MSEKATSMKMDRCRSRPRPFKPPDAGPLSFSNSPIHEPGSSNIVQVICLQQEFFSSSANFVGESQTCSALPFITIAKKFCGWLSTN